MPSKKKKNHPTKQPTYAYLLNVFLICKTGDNLQRKALQEIAFTCDEAFSPFSTPLPAAVLQVISIAWL